MKSAQTRNLSLLQPTIMLSMVVAALLLRQFAPAPELPDVEDRGPSIGTEDNPYARADFEWLQLRDPNTGDFPPNIAVRERTFAATLPVKSLAKVGDIVSGEPIFNWTKRGPFNVSGRTRAIGIDVSNPDVLIAGAVSGGLWRSEDGGASWTKTTEPNQIHSVTDLTQDTRPGHRQEWYYCSGELVGNSASSSSGAVSFYFGAGVFKSENGGRSWNRLESTAGASSVVFDSPFDICWRIVVNPVADGPAELYVATHSGIQRSTDGGASWTQVLGDQLGSSQFTDIAVSPTGVFYATFSSEGATDGVFRSTDGVNWTDISPDVLLGPHTVRRIVLDIAPADENVVYFYANTPGYGFRDVTFLKYTYLGGDGSGENGVWEERWQNLPALAGRGTLNTQTSYNMIVRSHPNDVNTVYIGGTALFRSTDGFTSLNNTTRIGGFGATLGQYIDYPNHHADQHNLKFYPDNPNRMLSSNDAGVWRSENNLAQPHEWENLNNGLTTTQFYTLAIDKSTPGSNFLMGGLQDRGSWYTFEGDGNAPWLRMRGADGAFQAVAENGTAFYTSIQQGPMYRYRLDENGFPTDTARVDPIGGRDYLFINPFAMDPNDDRIMYVLAGEFIWRNDNLSEIPNGNRNATPVNWHRLENSNVDGRYTAIAVAATPANRIYAGALNGAVLRVDNADQNDAEFENIGAGKGLPAGASFLQCIAVDPQDGDHVVLVYTSYGIRSLWATWDAGETWQSISGNLEENPDGSGAGPSTRWAEIVHDGEDTFYFVATSTGLYSTSFVDGDNTVWAREAPDLIGNTVVTMITSRPSDGYIAVATHGGGMYSTNVSSDVEGREQLVTSIFELEEPYPNPVESQTTVALRAERTIRANLKIVDLQGRVVAEMFNNRELHAGRHSFNLSTARYNMAPGRYYVLLEADGQKRAKALTVLR